MFDNWDPKPMKKNVPIGQLIFVECPITSSIKINEYLDIRAGR